MPSERPTFKHSSLESQTGVIAGIDPFVVTAGIIVVILLMSLFLWSIGDFSEHGSTANVLPEISAGS